MKFTIKANNIKIIIILSNFLFLSNSFATKDGEGQLQPQSNQQLTDTKTNLALSEGYQGFDKYAIHFNADGKLKNLPYHLRNVQHFDSKYLHDIDEAMQIKSIAPNSSNKVYIEADTTNNKYNLYSLTNDSNLPIVKKNNTLEMEKPMSSLETIYQLKNVSFNLGGDDNAKIVGYYTPLLNKITFFDDDNDDNDEIYKYTVDVLLLNEKNVSEKFTVELLGPKNQRPKYYEQIDSVKRLLFENPNKKNKFQVYNQAKNQMENWIPYGCVETMCRHYVRPKSSNNPYELETY